MSREAPAKLNRQADESEMGFNIEQGQSGPGSGTVLAQWRQRTGENDGRRPKKLAYSQTGFMVGAAGLEPATSCV